MILILLTFVLTLFIAFFSGSEIAFFAANRFKLELLSSQGSMSGRVLSGFLRQPARFISTLLIGLTLSLILYGMVTARLLEPWLMAQFGWNAEDNELQILLTETVISTVFVLILGEYLPKVFFRLYADRVLVWMAPLLGFTHSLLRPLVWVTERITRLILGSHIEQAEHQAFFSKQDLYHYMVQTLPAEEETDTELDAEAFTNALDLNKTRVREFMVPRTEIEALPIEATMAEARAMFAETEHSRLLIYRETMDDILGYAQIVDVLRPNVSLADIIRLIPIVPETMPANLLLAEFHTKGTTLALVVDEFGGTAGLATLEDLVEEVFGEIEDEHDDDDDENSVEEVMPDGSYRFSGRLEVEYLNRTYNLELPTDGDYATLSGLVLFYAERILVAGEQIELDQFRFTVEVALNNRIDIVRVEPHLPEAL
jgi:putative hemolysin